MKRNKNLVAFISEQNLNNVVKLKNLSATFLKVGIAFSAMGLYLLTKSYKKETSEVVFYKCNGNIIDETCKIISKQIKKETE